MTISCPDLLRFKSVTLAALLCAAAPAQTWIRDVDDPTLEAHGLAVDHYGRVAVVRDSGDYGGVTLFDADGVMLANYDLATYDGSEMSLQDGLFLPDGKLVVCGSVGLRPWVAAIDAATGIPYWQTTFTDGSTEGQIKRMTLNDLGHVVCQGYVFSFGSPFTEGFAAAVKPAQNGATAYRRVLGDETYTSLSSTANGALLMAGYDGGMFVVRTSNWGQPDWHKKYTSNQSIVIPRVVETTSGELMAVGLYKESENNGIDQYRVAVHKMASDGSLLWRRNIDSFPALDWGHITRTESAVAMPDGGVLACISQTMPGDGTRDASLLRIAANGDVMFLHPFGKVGIDDEAREVVATPDGGSYALASVEGGGFRLLRADANGLAGGCVIQPMATSPLPVSTGNVQTLSFDYTNYSDFWGDVDATPIAHASTVTAVCGQPCGIVSTPYGLGKPGTGGHVPTLSATDGHCLGYTPDLVIDEAVGGTLAVMFVGSAPANFPLLGGTLLVDLAVANSIAFAVDGLLGAPGQGTATIPLGTDLTGLLGASFYLQAIFLDAGAVGELSATNGLSLTIQ